MEILTNHSWVNTALAVGSTWLLFYLGFLAEYEPHPYTMLCHFAGGLIIQSGPRLVTHSESFLS